MESRKFLTHLLFVFLLLSGSGEMAAVEGWCWEKHPTFKGICLLKSQCVRACNGIGYGDGQCLGIPHKCFCRVPC